MEDLYIPVAEDEHDKPFVHFQAASGHCELSGESFPEQTEEFYKRLYEWLEQYMEEVKGPVRFDLRMTYFNTSSSKRLLYLLMKLNEYSKKGGNVKASWYYHKDDIDLEEDIEDLVAISGLKMEMIPVPDLKKSIPPDK